MGYLDNTTITVDAILTKKGRELLAKGRNQFNITQFALADDEIDYDLWNPSHPGGTDFYGAVIENMPITEAVPDETQSLKYKLITMPQGTTQIPYIDPTSPGIASGIIKLETNQTTPANGTLIRPRSVQLNPQGQRSDPNSSYSYHILDNTYVTFSTETSMLAGRSVSVPDVASSQGVTLVATGTQLPQGAVATTKLIISGNQTGARLVIPIQVTQAQTTRSNTTTNP